MLQFLGRGSAFMDEHNSAYFTAGNDLVLLDCPMSSFIKLKKWDLSIYDRIFVLITHTHGDHAGGVAMLIDYNYFIAGTPVTVVAPSKVVADDLRYLFDNIEGCGRAWYELVEANDLKEDWFVAAIPTSHTKELEGKCFGYCLEVDGNRVVYTGDTNTYEPFERYLEKGTYFYTEVSSYKSNVHVFVDDIKSRVAEMSEKGVRVFLMHLDDEARIKQTLEGTGAELAPLFEEDNMKDNTDLLNNIYEITDSLYKDMCMSSSKDHALLFSYLTDLGKTIVDADRASFWKWDKRKGELWTMSATGVDKIVIPDSTGLVGKSLRTQKTVITNDPYSDPDFNKEVDKKTGYVTKSVLVLPVADINGSFIGALQLVNKNDDKGFDEVEDMRKLSLAALVCGIALESETFLEESHHDKLTGLKNRMGFYFDFGGKYKDYLLPDSGKTMSVFICDIDKFKRVNDTYGHNAGDDVLAFTSHLIESTCTENDSVYRWGGEEFVMVMRDTTLEEARQKLTAAIDAVLDEAEEESTS